jgi:hypothetical protein
MIRFVPYLLLITLVSLAAFSTVQPHPVSYAATPTYRCSGADFQFPMKGHVGWLWHDPRSQWYDPAIPQLPDTDNGKPLTGNPIIHTGVDMFPVSQNASDRAVYPLADGIVVRLVGNQVGSQPFNIWYPKQRVYSYFTHVNHNLTLGQEVSANQQIGTVVGHIHFSISRSQTPPPQNPDGTVDKTKLPISRFSDLDPNQTRDPSALFRANLADPTNYAWKGKFGPTVDYVDKEGTHFPRATAPEGAPKNVAWTARESTFCASTTPPPSTPPSSTAVDVMLIIDSSSSMATTDPGNQRIQAALTYLTASGAGDRVESWTLTIQLSLRVDYVQLYRCRFRCCNRVCLKEQVRVPKFNNVFCQTPREDRLSAMVDRVRGGRLVVPAPRMGRRSRLNFQNILLARGDLQRRRKVKVRHASLRCRRSGCGDNL